MFLSIFSRSFDHCSTLETTCTFYVYNDAYTCTMPTRCPHDAHTMDSFSVVAHVTNWIISNDRQTPQHAISANPCLQITRQINYNYVWRSCI